MRVYKARKTSFFKLATWRSELAEFGASPFGVEALAGVGNIDPERDNDKGRGPPAE
ncbi:hypothetical protein CBOM_04140 [Ceraceosorus bombacis]|uniref:Uncharacterized protein n=1 Tax=Ceraceosorus bombacis TaxID=401625 RepID=A0A0P1BPP4_9BASI|nr:hypothetical protein CBOM_04140 [Ceraceosorus bombacis]